MCGPSYISGPNFVDHPDAYTARGLTYSYAAASRGRGRPQSAPDGPAGIMLWLRHSGNSSVPSLDSISNVTGKVNSRNSNFYKNNVGKFLACPGNRAATGTPVELSDESSEYSLCLLVLILVLSPKPQFDDLVPALP